ncbi:MAG: hypothetical protein HYV09_02000 [Deltaproteobacteria bacterium]|nr:hypothetical protein [Deltaproteobacteria bacterium]
MSDRKKLSEDLSIKAALAAGKNAARRVYDDLTLTEDEKAAREVERARARRILKWKLAIGAVVAVVLVATIVALLAKIWLWLLGLVFIAAIAAALWFWVRPKLARPAPERPVAELPAHRDQVDDAERLEAEQAREVAARARAEEASRAAREKAIDEELAALKAKARK